MAWYNRFKFKLKGEEANEQVTLNISRYDYEMIVRSLEECYFRELEKTPWEQENPGEFPPQYHYRGNHITKRLKSVLNYIKRQIVK